MEAHNNVVSFKRDAERLHTKDELQEYARYCVGRALAAAIYESGLGPDDLFVCMQDHIDYLEQHK